MARRLKDMFFGIVVALVVLGAAAYGYLHLPKFGALPEGSRQQAAARSPVFADGIFHNREPIPPSPNRGGLLQGWASFLFAQKERPAPSQALPSVKTDIKALDPAEDVVIWFGHSSFYIQLAGKRILVDPVFSDNAAPVPFANRAFAGTNVYTAEDMPKIDYLLITHDHWDHLDYPTVMALRDTVGSVICPLGVGAHFDRWGFAPDSIREGDWDEVLALDDQITVHILTARHYSGRLPTRNKALWSALALVSPGRNVYISGDSGYGSHFAEAGERFGGFDLAILDTGQYNETGWRYVHMTPEDAAQATLDLRAKVLIPAHIGKFSIAYHSWDDPFVRLAAASKDKNYRLLTPMIGETARLNDADQRFGQWWEPLRQSELGAK